ncbi:MAG: Ig domain-containing protein [Lachnospiraceae bacterium]|nr:Ig domain-containing protein [Lachnospiraceae bacterium]
MKKLNKVLWLCLFLLSCILKLNTAQAAEGTLLANDEWISGSLNDDVAYYRFYIPSAGKVTFTFQSYSDGGKCSLLNNDWSKSYGYVECDGSSVSPSTNQKTYDMEAGTYYLKVYSWHYGDNWTGDYRVKISFEPANNNETEPNNSFDNAMPLISDTLVTGYISEDDDIDFYKFTINTAQTVEIIWTNRDEINFSVWDADYLAVKDDDWFYSGSHTWEKYLQSGTYYIKFRKNDTGSYTLKMRTKQYVTLIQLKKQTVVLNKGGSYNLLSAILPNNATNKSLLWTTSNNDVVSLLKTTSGTKIKAIRAGYAFITAESQDGSNVKAQSVVVVRPEKVKAPSLSISSWDNHRILINLKSINGASGYQIMYSKNKNFKSKKYFTTSYSDPNIYNCKARTRYYIRVRAYTTYNRMNYYGAWSNTKSIKTKK